MIEWERGKEYVAPINNITWNAIKKAVDKMLKEDKERKVVVYINGIAPQIMKVGSKK